MIPARALVLLLVMACLAGAACGSSNSSIGQSSGAGGGTGSGGSGGFIGCQVNINPVIPSSFQGLVAAPGATLRVSGDISGPPPAAFTWQWSVTAADGSPVPVTTVAGSPSLIEFSTSTAGTYSIDANLVGTPACSGRRTVAVTAPGAKTAVFHLRFTPPPGAEPIQEQQIQVFGGTPSGGNSLQLQPGVAFTANVESTGMQPLDAYVRLTDTMTGIVIETHRAAAAAAPVLQLWPSGVFDLLVVPDGDVAPLLVPQQTVSSLVAGMPQLPLGETVTGVVQAGSTPVAGATVVLRAGALPSTIATTHSDGTFTLHAAAGTYAATVTRPVALTMGTGQTATSAAGTTMANLEATLPASPGVIVVSGVGATMSVDLGALDTTALSLSLGTSVAAGTQVLLESAPFTGQVTFQVAGQARAGGATVRGQMAPASDGTVALAGLPRAHYHGKVVPGAGMSAAITPIADLDLTGSAPPPQTVALLAKVSLGGNLVPSKQAAGVALTAVDTTGDLPSAIASTTDGQGNFTLAVSPNRTYALHVRPTPDRSLAQAVFGPLAVGPSGLQVQNQQMPGALLFAGQVLDHSGKNGSGATLIQVTCDATIASCTDPQTPIAETVTAADGTFALLLPDPGVN